MDLRTRLLSLAAFACIAVAPPALAHKVNVFAYAEEGEVYVEGYFVDGKKAQNSKVEVFSPGGELLLEGVTDDEGQYRFPVPQQTDLKIVLNAGMGHQNDITVRADELGGAAAADDAHAVTAPATEPVAAATTSRRVDSARPGDQELQAIVSHAVNEAIKPLVRELSASQQKASLTGIVGGVGYIIGFLGLFAYFKARQNTPPK